jgi:tryptophan 2,3-dioxygenase
VSDIKILKKFDEIDAERLFKVQRKYTRRNIPEEISKEWSMLHLEAKEILEDERRGDAVVKIADFVFLITESIHNLRLEPTPRYYTYTDVKVLDWFIGREHRTYKHYKEKCILGIIYLLHDLSTFEGESMSGFTAYNQEHQANIKIDERIKKIGDVLVEGKLIYQEVFGKEFDEIAIRREIVHHKKVIDYANEENKINGLITFTCFPRTQTHDEYAFLRTIHISEFCFLGIINTIKETIDNIKYRADAETATKCLNEACHFADILHGIFKVLRTMPYKPDNNFEYFRDETGNASAVQSKNYQELDVYLKGIDDKKKEVFSQNSHLKYLEKFAHPQFTYNFKHVLSTLDESDPKWEGVFKIARKLDGKLKTWRGLHIVFANTYLPQDAIGTGSTSGASYLKKLLDASVFDDTVIDYEIFKEEFPDEEFSELHRMLTRVSPRIGTAIDNEY